MAGSYPDALDNKIPYDDDGSVGFSLSTGGVVTPLPAGGSVLQAWNDFELPTIPPGGGGQYVGVIFSVNQDVSAMFVAGDINLDTVDIQSSTNTTNGQDGTWSAVISHAEADRSGLVTTIRTGVYAVSSNVTNIKAIRVSRSPAGSTFDVTALHIYGHRHTANDLMLWHPTLNQPLYQTPAQLDFGDIARGSSGDQTFRIKNAHSTQTANGIVVSVQIQTDASPTLVGQTQLSQDGGSTYANSQNIGNLAAGAISPVLHYKDSPSAGAQTGLWYPRLKAAATSWT